MRASLRPLLAASLLLSVVGCGGDNKDPARAVCELHFGCDCEPVNFPDVDACIADLNAQITARDDADKDIASANGLVFDQGCADRSRQVPDDFGCDYDPPEDVACVACAVVHGDQPLGSPCVVKADEYSDCARDLVCFKGLCLDPCQRLKTGDNCVGDSLAQCDDGLFCDSNNTKQCQPTGGAGAPCPTGDGCDEGLFCGDDDTCEAPPPAGEPCGPAGLCAEQLYCAADMTCTPVPGAGEPCDVVCVEHHVCTGGTCVVGPAVGEPCPVGVCAPGAECAGDTCVAEQSPFCSLEPSDDEML